MIRDPDSVEAQQTLMLPGAANFVATTSAALASDTRESLYWVSPQGVRFGIDWDRNTLQALGIDPNRAVQAPWPIIRTFAAGPAISRANALLARDAISPAGPAAALAGRRGSGRVAVSKRGFVRGTTHGGADGAAGAGHGGTAAGAAGTRAPQHPADDRRPGAAGGDPRDPAGDVHLRGAVAAVRLLPADRHGRVRRPDVQRPVRPRSPDQLGRTGEAAPRLSAPTRRGPRRDPARRPAAATQPTVRPRRSATAGHRHRWPADVGTPPGGPRFPRRPPRHRCAVDRGLGGIPAVAGGTGR